MCRSSAGENGRHMGLTQSRFTGKLVVPTGDPSAVSPVAGRQ
jgi:hypothetical protein